MCSIGVPDIDVLRGHLQTFRNDLSSVDPETAVQKYLTYGNCCLLPSNDYFELKREVAAHFQIHPSEVLVVGSAKLGFSIAPNKRYQLFGESSDIDIALVAPQLFEQMWAEVYDYKRSGAYWENHDDFCRYLFQGWIRPDKLPPSHLFVRCEDWWDYFRRLTQSGRFGPFTIRAGLYRSWKFFEGYHQGCIIGCKLET